MADTNHLEHRISLCASHDRVWTALTDPEQFAYWFGASLDAGASFVEGERLTGTLAPSKADPQTARTQKAYFGASLTLTLERVEAARLLSFRWHPFAWEVPVEDPNEPLTHVVVTLSATGDRTDLTITESGFDRFVPARSPCRRAASQRGWVRVTYHIEKYLAGARDLRPHQGA